jgi:hypothetical protein
MSHLNVHTLLAQNTVPHPRRHIKYIISRKDVKFSKYSYGDVMDYGGIPPLSRKDAYFP